MAHFEVWIADCQLAHIERDGEYLCQAGIWADSHDEAMRRLATHLDPQGYRILWVDECRPQHIFYDAGLGEILRHVSPEQPVFLGPMVTKSGQQSPEKFLLIKELNSLEPLDQQFGVHPKKCVPETLMKPLFDEVKPSKADISRYGGLENVPTLKTYLVVDVFHFPDWVDELSNLTSANKCLFYGDAQKTFSDSAPYLIEAEVNNPFICKLFTYLERFNENATVHYWHKPYGIWIRSREPFEEIYSHLRRFTKLQDEDGRWFFRRFWDARHCYALLPLLKDEFAISARFFGHTRGAKTSKIKSLSVVLGAYNSFRSAIWNEDLFLEAENNELLPESRTQYLDAPYVELMRQATERVSLFKVVDYLIKTFDGNRKIGDGSRHAAEEFAVQMRLIGQKIGVASELGWTRVAVIAGYLGTRFLDDPRYASRGLSYDKIVQDSQGEKIFFLGNECLKQMQAIGAAFVARDQMNVAHITGRFGESALGVVLNAVEMVDPNAEWWWGQSALQQWAKLYLTKYGANFETQEHVYQHVALAYLYGLDFPIDLRWSFHQHFENSYDDDYAMITGEIFKNEFGEK